MENCVLIVGSTRAEVQAALDLADCGIQVYLIESKSFLGSQEEYLSPDLYQNTRLLELLKHPRIKTWTNTVLEELNRKNGKTQALIYQSPRYVDLTKCTACGDCLEICPITIPETGQKAITLGGQPGCAVIQKAGISPCTNACPAGIHVQGYVALIAQRRYKEAYQLIHDALPFPSVCGRVCNHLCETACTRSQLDEAVNLMGLKRYVADWAFENQDEVPTQEHAETKLSGSGKKVAVIGAGPAGLTAARDLARMGHQVKVFDANPEPGGMMRIGIPPHRLSYQQLQWEIDHILAEGVELQLNTWVDDIPGLLKKGFDAVLISAGVGKAIKPDLPNVDHPDNWLSLEFLRKVCLGEKIDLSGRRVIVMGGGDVAMDAARSALRLGHPQVKILCRGLRASDHELSATLEEGIEIIKDRVFQSVDLENGKICGITCLRAEVGEVVDGKRQFSVIPESDHQITGDLVIWALGQRADHSFLPSDGGIQEISPRGINTDHDFMTTLKGVFAAGDIRRGNTYFVVDAVGEGHQVALAINRYLAGDKSSPSDTERKEVILNQDEMKRRLNHNEAAQKGRISSSHLPIKDRENSFSEVDLTLGESEALEEAGRCLVCGPCSECMACLEVCQPGAINYYQAGTTHNLDVGSVLIPEKLEFDADNHNFIRIEVGDEFSGSAAAYQAMMALGVNGVHQGSQLLRISDQSSADDKGIGLVLCQCGGEISRYVDLEEISKRAHDWDDVIYTEEVPLACSREGAKSIQDLIKGQNIGQLVLAACSCCSLDQICYSCTYQRMRCKENLGVFDQIKSHVDLEFVNIREQCAWVHSQNRGTATTVAERLIKSTLSRLQAGTIARLAPDLKPRTVGVIGGGLAAERSLDLLDRAGIQMVRIQYLPKEIFRNGGGYLIKNGKQIIKTDLILLAPKDKRELTRLGKAYHLLNGRAVIGTITDQRELLNYGVVICPPDLEPEIASEGAVAQILSWMYRLIWSDLDNSAEVDPLRCRACGTCQEVCGFGIPDIAEDDFGRHATIDPRLCLGCGICAAQCPSGAITPGSTPEYVLEGMINAILE
jgi:NADPH-dependent glutamate synthase beta subunit-like oxidoreductase/formate hydrogenlyase subunit 6/NADH:ubiquinone oxidoreductase subunit I